MVDLPIIRTGRSGGAGHAHGYPQFLADTEVKSSPSKDLVSLCAPIDSHLPSALIIRDSLLIMLQMYLKNSKLGIINGYWKVIWSLNFAWQKKLSYSLRSSKQKNLYFWILDQSATALTKTEDCIWKQTRWLPILAISSNQWHQI